jgi:GNAT superfamily N-acetyltransferase
MNGNPAGGHGKLRLRTAQAADVDVILSFIQELAEYERLVHLVEADAESLRETLFGSARYAEVVIAEYDTQPAGFALFFHNYSTFMARPGLYLEDLYVKPAFRGSGIGGRLLAHLGELAVQRGCGRLEFSVLDWNQPAIDVYENLGAQPLDDWTTYRFTGSALRELATRYPTPDR